MCLLRCDHSIWEMQKQKNVASFAEHTGTLLGLAFSENGYHLASIGTDAVKIWDLRKLKCLRCGIATWHAAV